MTTMTQRQAMLFDRELAAFQPLPDINVLTIDQIFQSPNILSSDETLFLDFNMHDIPVTMIRSLRRLTGRHAECFASIYAEPWEAYLFGTVLDARLDVKLIATATIPPSEVKPDAVEEWKRSYARFALEAGCDGVKIDFVPHELGQQYSDRFFFMMQEVGA